MGVIPEAVIGNLPILCCLLNKEKTFLFYKGNDK